MPYIGKSPSFGVRNRFVFTPDAGATSVSGADANSSTLTFTDGAFVDVYLNGVLLKPTTDYNTNTANTIAGLTATVANDEVTVIVYDVFAVGDTVSAVNGGTFSGGVNIDGAVTINESSADVDFRVESNGNANMLFVDGGNNTVGIGTTAAAPSRLLTLYDDNAYIALQSSHSGTAVGDGFQIQKDTSNNAYLWNYENATMNLATNNTNRITIGSGGDVDIETGDIFFSTAGKGIVLGATSNTDANTLDDYEEGTWTPAISISSSDVVDAANSTKDYRKIGDVVYISAHIVLDGAIPDGAFTITGLPFAIGGRGAMTITVQDASSSYIAFDNIPTALVDESGQDVTCDTKGTAYASADRINISGFYFTSTG